MKILALVWRRQIVAPTFLVLDTSAENGIMRALSVLYPIGKALHSSESSLPAARPDLRAARRTRGETIIMAEAIDVDAGVEDRRTGFIRVLGLWDSTMIV